MKLKNLAALVISILLLSAVSYAQDEMPIEEEQKESSKIDALFKTRIGCSIWLNYHAQMDRKNDVNMFEIERAYITLAKRFNDYFSANIVWDIAPEVEFDGTGTSTQLSKKYNAFLKVANLTAIRQFGPVKLGIKGGLIDTPYFFTATRNADYHINRDPIEYAGIDPLFDLGAGFIVKLYDYVDFYFTITEGEGYKNIEKMNDRGKAYAARLSMSPAGTPAEGLTIDGYGYINLPNGNDMADTQYGYAGFGLTYKVPVIKVGTTIINRQAISSIAGDRYELQNNAWIIDFWANVDLESVTNHPFLLWFMFEYYHDTDGNGLASNLANPVNSASYYLGGIGFGYRPHKYIETNIVYTHKNVEGIKQVNTFYIKAALRF